MYMAVRVFLTLVVVAAAIFLGYEVASYYLYSPWTRDARIRADVVTAIAWRSPMPKPLLRSNTLSGRCCTSSSSDGPN
jgi:hypothetical protein